MKRVYLILTLFMTSFFFVSLKEVRADTYEYSIPESSFEYINDDFYFIRDYALNYVEEKGNYYLIYYNPSSSIYRVFFFYPDSVSLTVTSSSFIFSVKVSNHNNACIYNFQDNEFKLYSCNYSWTFTQSFNNDDNTVSLLMFLDSNFNFFIDEAKSEIDEFRIFNNNNSYTVNSSNALPMLYQIYLDSNVVLDPYEDEKEIINNFYSTIVNKIGTLATSFAGNYIFLLIFGIFILIFVFELIRRRFI